MIYFTLNSPYLDQLSSPVHVADFETIDGLIYHFSYCIPATFEPVFLCKFMCEYTIVMSVSMGCNKKEVMFIFVLRWCIIGVNNC